jgi:hypothetical protein
MVNQPHYYEQNSEFFLLASYSCLPTVIARLVELQTMNTNAVLFCYSNQLYQFLSPLMKIYEWIKVINIDVTELNKISPYRPWKIFRGRKLLQSIYLQWFSEIPKGCRVNFYNRYYALSTFFMIWLIKRHCEIHFTDCDFIENIEFKKNNTLYSIFKTAFLSMLYPMPFEIVSGHDGVKPFPALNKSFYDKTVKFISPMVNDLSDFKQTELFQKLSYKSDKQVLWLMSPVLDINLVPSEEYKQAFKTCVDVVNSIYPSWEQAVKYHPRTIKKEISWDSTVECIPNEIPVEFLDMPKLEIVIAFSTSSLWSFPSKTILIGLVDLLPFISLEAHKARRKYFLSYKSSARKYIPTALKELQQILTDKNLQD